MRQSEGPPLTPDGRCVFSSGCHGDDEHLQAAEVPAGAERLRPGRHLRPALRAGLPAAELRSPHGEHLPQHHGRRTQAVEPRVRTGNEEQRGGKEPRGEERNLEEPI